MHIKTFFYIFRKLERYQDIIFLVIFKSRIHELRGRNSHSSFFKIMNIKLVHACGACKGYGFKNIGFATTIFSNQNIESS